MKIIQKTKENMIFQAKVSESLANAIRKYMNRIPILAIDEVNISKNGSPLYDETVAHRMGLIPLKMDKSINEKSSVNLKLSSKKEGFVKSGELKGSAKPAYDNMPVTYLKSGQELKMSGIARTGKGIEHSKFAPGLMFYRNVLKINVDKDCPKEIVNSCPKKVFKGEDGRVVVADALKCDMCEECVDTLKKYGKDYVKLVPTDELVVTLESFGQLENKEIIKKSIDALKKDLNSISKKIK